MPIEIKVTDTVSPDLGRLLTGLRGPGFAQAATRSMRTYVQAFYRGLQITRPNQMDWPRQNFWAAVAGSVQTGTSTNPAEASVTITHIGIRQRIQGGYIRPGPGKKYLTIPAKAEAYGHRAREFPNLKFGFAQNEFGGFSRALVDKTSEWNDDAVFWLVRQVYQRPDPSVAPDASALTTAATQGMNDYARTLTSQGGAR